MINFNISDSLSKIIILILICSYMANENFFKQISFLISANEVEHFPQDEGGEVAFVGYSNAGKSSAINAIAGIKNLARTSKTPGRTQLINFFKIDDKYRLVDLPGYGYAKAAKNISYHWRELIRSYLEIRGCLSGIILIMDIRHPLKELDNYIIQWAEEYKLPAHILLTKADKLSRSATLKTLQNVEKILKSFGSVITVQLFSAHSNLGIDEARDKIIGSLKIKT